ncbi:hypothetical protein ACS0TY_020777 [Phlomoides rotata]
MSYTEDNPGMRFMRCPLRETDDCKFFEWINDNLPPQYKIVATRVARRMNNIEAQLKEKVQREAILEQELRMIERKLGVIEERNKELQNLNMELIRRLNGETLATKDYVLPRILFIMLFLFLVLVVLVSILVGGLKATTMLP